MAASSSLSPICLITFSPNNHRKAITHTSNSIGIGYPNVLCYFA